MFIFSFRHFTFCPQAFVLQAFNGLYKEFYETLKPQRVFELEMLTVDPNYSGLGISTDLSKTYVCQYIPNVEKNN